MEPGAVPHEQRGGLKPWGCSTGTLPDTRGHDNIIVHRIGHLGQRQRTDHQRSHHGAVARHDPDWIPRRQQKHARTHPHLPPVQGRSLHCGGGDTLPGQNRNPAITPWPSSGNTTRRPPRCNVHVQMICADYFCYDGHNYLVIVDRYSGWPYVSQLTGTSPALVKKLREFFVTYGIAEELASDGGPEFTAAFTQQFLRDWGVAQRLSSVAYPHSNTRAEIGVKSAKRMIMENTGPQGDVDIPAFQRAMLTYRNTPTSLDNRSPAEIVFGRQIRDFVPVMPGKYEPCDTWKDTAANREKALMERHAKEVEAILPHTRKMPPLKVGNSVRIQNQTGNAPRRWDKCWQVVEVRQNDQYAIKVHGSGRVTLRNRQFLRLYVESRTRRSRAHAASLMPSLPGPLTLGGCHYPYSPRRI